jgi:hypothetical protein
MTARGSKLHIIVGLIVAALLAWFLAVCSSFFLGPRPHPSWVQERNEIADLEVALLTYKERLGEYPPDNASDTEALRAHLAKAFPKCDLDRAVAAVPKDLDQAASLVFWLGGPIDADGKQNGFSANPLDPFDDNPSRIGPFFEFARERLKKDGGGFRYYPRNGQDASEPLVYFRAKPDGTYSGQWRNCKPCQDWRNGESDPPKYINLKSYQLRSPGLDGKHGSGVQFPTGGDYDQYQYDDLANFSDGTFGDKIP